MSACKSCRRKQPLPLSGVEVHAHACVKPVLNSLAVRSREVPSCFGWEAD